MCFVWISQQTATFALHNISDRKTQNVSLYILSFRQIRGNNDNLTGHTERMEEDRYPKTALHYHPIGRSNTGRPGKNGNETGPGWEALALTGKRTTVISSNNTNDCVLILSYYHYLTPSDLSSKTWKSNLKFINKYECKFYDGKNKWIWENILYFADRASRNDSW